MIEWRIEIAEGEYVPSGFLQAPDSHVGKIVDKVVFIPENCGNMLVNIDHKNISKSFHNFCVEIGALTSGILGPQKLHFYGG
jgi:hypothetical protein